MVILINAFIYFFVTYLDFAFKEFLHRFCIIRGSLVSWKHQISVEDMKSFTFTYTILICIYDGMPKMELCSIDDVPDIGKL